MRSSAASGQHGTTAAHYQVRRLAKTLSGTVKGPKRVPLSLRVAARQEIHSGFARYDRKGVVKELEKAIGDNLDGISVL